tara:strand:- start:8 stop:286 length:279 start_codon:yes stop_codon:yes gene_type:complete
MTDQERYYKHLKELDGIKVGDLATISCGSDTYGYEVDAIKGTTITFYRQAPLGCKTLSLRKVNGRWAEVGLAAKYWINVTFGEATDYRDPSF